MQEVGICGDRVLVRVAAAHMRPTEVKALRGDASQISSQLGWSPEITFPVRLSGRSIKLSIRRFHNTRSLFLKCHRVGAAAENEAMLTYNGTAGFSVDLVLWLYMTFFKGIF